jgi:hypothetical protein
MSEPKLPCWLECPECGHQSWCSEEDPDAGQGDMWNHLYWDHALGNVANPRALTLELLAKVTVVPDARR